MILGIIWEKLESLSAVNGVLCRIGSDGTIHNSGGEIGHVPVGTVPALTSAYKITPFFLKARRDENGGDYLYPNVIGIVGLNGDIRDVHNHLAGHLDFDDIDSCKSTDTTSLAKMAYKIIRHYESKNPWHKPKK